MSDYPKKFVFINSETKLVGAIQVAYSAEVEFTPSDGYFSKEVDLYLPVEVDDFYNSEKDNFSKPSPVSVAPAKKSKSSST